MTALFITIKEPNILCIDNLCREDATDKEKEVADAIEKLIGDIFCKELIWQIGRNNV